MNDKPDFKARALADGLAYYVVMIDHRKRTSKARNHDQREWKRYPVGSEAEMEAAVFEEVDHRWPGEPLDVWRIDGVLMGISTTPRGAAWGEYRVEIQMGTRNNEMVQAWWAEVHR